MKKLSEYFQDEAAKLGRSITELHETSAQRMTELPARLAEVEKLLGAFARVEGELPNVDEFGIEDYTLSERHAENMVSAGWQRCITANVETLRKLRTLFGPFTLDDNDKSIHDAEKNLVSIRIKFETEPLTFYVETVRKLPESAKCKIVEVENKYKTIVCSRD